VGRCKAHQCPEDEIEGERAFCVIHWDMLPAAYRVWLFDAFDTLRWRQVLAECARELRRIEGTQR
jgi:isocitrate dehydrogenase kinase/phosphatase